MPSSSLYFKLSAAPQEALLFVATVRPTRNGCLLQARTSKSMKNVYRPLVVEVPFRFFKISDEVGGETAYRNEGHDDRGGCACSVQQQ